MLIDSHIHVFPDALAPKVIPKLAAISGYDNQTDGTLASTLEKCGNGGWTRAFFSASPPSPPNKNPSMTSAPPSPPIRVIPFGSVHPDAPDWEPELERIAALGLRGIKLHPDYQDFDMDEPRVLPIFQKARDLGCAWRFTQDLTLFLRNISIAAPAPAARCWTPALAFG